MDFIDLAKSRYSVRKFDTKKVEQEKLDKILLAGHVAPTGCNYQSQRILVLNEEDSLNKLKLCTKYHFDCPLALVICYNKDECWTRKYDGVQCGMVDASIVTTHMMLEAWEQGIGSTWVMSFNPEELKKQFNIADNLFPTAILTLGYPAKDCPVNPLHNKFKDLNEIVYYNKF